MPAITEPEEFVLLSGVRSGLKREFAFALKARASLPSSLARTRSGKSPPSPNPKRLKRSDGQDAPPIAGCDATAGSDADVAPEVIAPMPPPPSAEKKKLLKTYSRRFHSNGLEDRSNSETAMRTDIEARINGQDKANEIVRELEDGDEANVKSNSLDRSTEAPSSAIHVLENSVDNPNEFATELSSKMEEKVTPVKFFRRFTRSSLKTLDEALLETPTVAPTVEDRSTVVDASIAAEASTGRSENSADHLDENFVESGLFDGGSFTLIPILFDGDHCMNVFRRHRRSTLKAVEDSAGEASIVPLSNNELRLFDVPIVFDDWSRKEMDMILEKKSSGRVTSSAPKVVSNEVDEWGQNAQKDAVRAVEYPNKRVTRSMLKTEGSGNYSGLPGLAEADNGPDIFNGSLGLKPKRKMELKMSKKIAVTKLPTNIRELLATGLLDGLPVMYASSNAVGKEIGLSGFIKGGGILCFCGSCKGSKVVSAFQFEIHAGSSKKHPSDFIYLENGKSLRDILKACTTTPLDMLEAAIQNAIGPMVSRKPVVCDNCKESFCPQRIGRDATLCAACLDLKLRQRTSSPLHGTSSSARSPMAALVSNSSESTSKSKSSSKKIMQGRLTRKDIGLHKLVFMEGILPEGTEVGYYACGKKLLDGYIKGFGIFCHCCNSVVSPSVFEAHAGRSQRRKPYNNIYTSNGVSLHELSVSLSKGRKLSASENDDLCSICADGGDLLCCDICPRAFHKECVGLSEIPKGQWYCQYCQNLHQRERALAHNDNAIAAGRVAGVDPIEQIFRRCIRIVKTPETDLGGCILCRCQDFSKSIFSERTVLLCDQCEKEYHVGCLKEHNMADLKELPEGEWFCNADCSRIYASLCDLLQHGPELLQESYYDLIKKKHEERGLSKDLPVDIRWRLLSGKASSADCKLFLSKAVSIFHESFDPIVDITGRDLIPSMVYGRNLRDQDYGGMYCAVLAVGSSVISAGIFRVLGCDIAELPLVATLRESQGLGYFQALFSCIERLLASLKVKHLVLPAADEAESIWTKKFGFSKVTPEKVYEYARGARPIIFQGTSMLHKLVPQTG